MQYYGQDPTRAGGLTTFNETYAYSAPGAMTSKTLALSRQYGTNPYSGAPLTTNASLTATYAYDNEGRTTSVQYPTAGGVAGPLVAYTYDSMGRLYGMSDANGAVIGAATYGPSGELLTLGGGSWGSEARSYNAMMQMVGLNEYDSSGSARMLMAYAYSGTQNNGKIVAQSDYISGESVVYTYDSLNRLQSAVTQDNPNVAQWGMWYLYDGFSNLTDQYVIKGSGVEMHTAYYASNNRRTSDIADANGNLGLATYNGLAGNVYDIENRISSVLTQNRSQSAGYAYSPSNKRVWKGIFDPSSGQCTSDELTFWSGANKQATYQIGASSTSQGVPTMTVTQSSTSYYFGDRLIKNASGYVYADRLGSASNNFYPYGLEKSSGANNVEKYETYYRDAETGLDYADQRYYQPGQGRFLTTDPFGGSQSPVRPHSWNRYMYAEDDPINLNDPTGLCPPGYVPLSAYDDSAAERDQIIDTAESYLGQGLTHADNGHYEDAGGVLTAIDCTGLVAQALAGISYSATNFREAPAQDGFSSSQVSSLFAPSTHYQIGDIISFARPGHAGIVTGVDASGNVTSFIGSQSSTGPKIVNVKSNPYWSKLMSTAKVYEPCVPAPVGRPQAAGAPRRQVTSLIKGRTAATGLGLRRTRS